MGSSTCARRRSAKTRSSGPSWAGPGPLALNHAGPASVARRMAVDQGRTCGCSAGPTRVSPCAASFRSAQASAPACQSGSSHVRAPVATGARSALTCPCHPRTASRRCRARRPGPGARSSPCRRSGWRCRSVLCWARAASRWAFSCATRWRSAAFWAAAISFAWRTISRCCWAGVIVFSPVAVVGSTPARMAASAAAWADAALAAAMRAVIRS